MARAYLETSTDRAYYFSCTAVITGRRDLFFNLIRDHLRFAVRSTLTFKLILFLFFSLIGPGFSQEINCASLVPEQSNLGYKRHSNRCEGFYLPKLSGNLQVVSFIRGGGLNFAWDEKTLLTVSRIDNRQIPIHIRAVSLQRNVFYQMDSLLDKNKTLDWPIGPYIHRRDINPGELGVYGWAGEEYDKSFFPVIVRQKDSDTLSDKQSTILKIRTVLDLTHFRWNLDVSKGSICHSETRINQFHSFEGEMSAGSTIEINIPPLNEDIRSRCLEIHYRPENRRWQSEIIRIRI